MKAMTAQRAMKDVQVEAEMIRNDETAVIGTVSVGDVVRQGDLYLVVIERLPEKKTPTGNKQLAPGTSQGSRHVLVGECRVFDPDKDESLELINEAAKGLKVSVELIGPVFESKAEIEVDHPEHGNRIIPAGAYAVVYQRAFAEEVRRQLD